MTDGRLLRVALTGGIASGKSYCRGRFERHGIPTIDADSLARDALAPGSAGLSAAVDRFGPKILRQDGTLDRPLLGALVFGDAAARRDLEGIVHPLVYEQINAWFTKLASAGQRVGVADIPLLFETGHEAAFDRVVVARCTPEQQMARLMARNELDEAAARARLDSQLPLEHKARLAHFVIDTSGTRAETDRQVEAVARRLAEDAA